MKTSLIVILLFVSIDLNDIAKINTLKEKAEEAYLKGNYQTAFESYKLLIDSFEVADDNLLLNYANSAYFLTGLKGGKITEGADASNKSNYAESAMTNYQKLSESPHKQLRSAAYNQIGVINYHMSNSVKDGQKYLSESLAYFKQSLKSDHKNDNARYNYEIVKKQLENQDQQQQDQNENKEEEKDQDQQNQDQQDQDQQNQEQQKDQQNQDQQQQENQESGQQEEQNEDQQNQSDQKQDQEEKQGEEKKSEERENQNGEKKEEEASQSPADKFKEMNISEEMAKMILEAMRNNEVQYIQQQKRKPTKRADSSKPDW